jgi:hypothetical protein
MHREDPITDAKNDEPEAGGKLKRKEYEQELARLDVEFVKLQQVSGAPLRAALAQLGQ